MRTDRELLELAAKAVGIEVTAIIAEGIPHRFGGGYWNPLTDDGDALRLANRLGLIVSVAPPWVRHRSTIARRENEGRGFQIMHGQDANSATRRAIVLAAAEIGAALNQEGGSK